MTKPKPKRSTQGKGRFSARKKAEAVRRLVAGDVLARELGLTAATLALLNSSQALKGRGRSRAESCLMACP